MWMNLATDGKMIHSTNYHVEVNMCSKIECSQRDDTQNVFLIPSTRDCCIS